MLPTALSPAYKFDNGDAASSFRCMLQFVTQFCDHIYLSYRKLLKNLLP